MDAPWIPALLFAALLAIPLFAWAPIGEDLLRWLTSGRHSAGVARRARAQGWRWSSAARVDLRPGLPFEFGGDDWCADVVRGEIREQPFVAFTYAHEFQVYVVPLRARLPHLQVKVRGLTDRAPLHAGAAEVESEAFNQRFIVETHDPRFASRVLSPRTVQRLLDERALSWRVGGSELIGWRAGELQGRAIHAVRRAAAGGPRCGPRLRLVGVRHPRPRVARGRGVVSGSRTVRPGRTGRGS
jgi:hypothetical protein